VDDAPASKRDLEGLGQELRAEMQILRADVTQLAAGQQSLRADVTQLAAGQQSLRADVTQLAAGQQILRANGEQLAAGQQSLRAEMAAMERRMLAEIGHALDVAVEQLGKHVSVVDDKYRDLPPEVAKIRSDLDEHRGDTRIHRKPASRAR